MAPSKAPSKVPSKAASRTTRASQATQAAPKPKLKPSVSKTRTPVKRDSLTNKSILNFFQKVDRPEESMFVGDDAGLGEPTVAKATQEEDDIYGAGDDLAPENRYNEVLGRSKRRKLSASEDHNDESPPKAASLSEEITPTKPPLSKKPNQRKGPFLDDSESEDEDQKPAFTTLSDRPDSKESEDLAKKEKEVGATTTSSPTPTSTKDPSRTSLTPAPDPVSKTIPPPLKPEYSETRYSGDFDGLDDNFDDELDDELFENFEGEELREMRFMKEQARLEAQETGNYSCDDGFETLMEDDGMTGSCPICNASLAGVTPDQATIHVNSCLDGNPTPLPLNAPMSSVPLAPNESSKPPPNASATPERQEKGALVSAPEVGKRFARSAVARPGQANPISIGGGGQGTNGGSTSAFSKLMSGHAEDAAWATAAATENASRGKPAYQRTCPFYKIMPGFYICVDAFRYGAVEGCRAYFLSHFHSDHYIGLTANWTHGPIYCSKVTGSLVKSQLKTAERYVVELEFENKVPVPGTDGVFVTMIPANHCPGSSLFLFEKSISNPSSHSNSKEKKTQRVLHCGDFRACPAHIEHPQLKPEIVEAFGKIKQQKIDVCYLDTTYLNPRYSFPPQSDVIQACANLCLELDTTLRIEDESEWNSVLRRREGRGAGNNDTVSRFFVAADKLGTDTAKLPTPLEQPSASTNALSVLGQQARANRNRLLVVCGTYSIGKERICKAIALALKTKIYASPAKIRICNQLGDPELAALMTGNPHEAQVHMQMLMELRAETLAEYLDHYRPHFGRVIGLRPSGWNYRPTLANNGGNGAAQVTSNMAPSAVPTTQILHGAGWRTRFGPRDLVPQQGSSREAMCFGVPYSEHSSFRELMLFIMALRIEKVVPTVNVGSEPSRRRMKGWTDRWLAERRRGGCVRVAREVGDGGEDVLGSDGEARLGDKEKGHEGVKEVAMWDGKDGRGGAVYW